LVFQKWNSFRKLRHLPRKYKYCCSLIFEPRNPNFTSIYWFDTSISKAGLHFQQNWYNNLFWGNQPKKWSRHRSGTWLFTALGALAYLVNHVMTSDKVSLLAFFTMHGIKDIDDFMVFTDIDFMQTVCYTPWYTYNSFYYLKQEAPFCPILVWPHTTGISCWFNSFLLFPDNWVITLWRQVSLSNVNDVNTTTMSIPLLDYFQN
jgi:hypothetical protein